MNNSTKDILIANEWSGKVVFELQGKAIPKTGWTEEKRGRVLQKRV